MFTHIRLVDAAKEESIRNNTNMLYIVMHTADTVAANMDNLQLQFFFSHTRPFALAENAPAAMDIIQLLRVIVSSNELVFDAAVHFVGDDFIYTSAGSFTTQSFFEHRYNFSLWNEEQFIHDISSLNRPLVRASEEVSLYGGTSTNLVSFIFPLRMMRTNAVDTVLIFMVDERFLLPQPMDDQPTAIFILNAQGDVIVSNMEASYVQSMLGDDFLTATIVSSNTGWEYVALSPQRNLIALTNIIRNDMLIVLLVIMSVASVVIFISIRSNFSPFAKLRDYAADFHFPTEGINEIDAVRETIQYLSRKNTDLINFTYTVSEEYVLRRLLYESTYYSKPEVERFMAEFDITFAYSSFAVIHLSPAKGSNMHLFAQSVKSLLPFSGYLIEGQPVDTLFVILNFDSNMAADFAEQIHRLHVELHEQTGSPLLIGVGNIYSSITDISKSCTEACFASYYRFIMGDNRVIFADEVVVRGGGVYPQLFSNLEKLRLLVHRGDAEGAKRILTAFLDSIKSSNISVLEARRLCNDMLNVFVKTAISLKIDDKIDKSAIMSAVGLIEHSTVDELIAEACNICYNICELVKYEELGKTSQIDNIKAYIQANYTDVNYSVQALADALDLSVPNISQYFKKKTSQTLMEYVTQLRMEDAKILLAKQKYKLEDIAGMVGYMNVSSFIRRFKQYYGTTPGQYAKDNISE